ncbi:hypothetical protein [Acidocella facilis]|uniref:hypothetical protein n=1 Tax=Acidocella facilis TaxID=525 RepID=UPI001F2D3550|nr:hypothetical protein [Acidocella facilis]
MQNVALFLQTKANSCPHDSRDFDLFGRSSFNRYYYAAYLEVRSLLGSLNESWATAQHSSIPKLLNGQIVEQIGRKRQRAAKLGDTAALQICSRAKQSAHDLAALMETAYATRVTADYHPEVIVEAETRGRFRLNLVSVTIAHDWPVKARENGERIKRAWRLSDE